MDRILAARERGGGGGDDEAAAAGEDDTPRSAAALARMDSPASHGAGGLRVATPSARPIKLISSRQIATPRSAALGIALSQSAKSGGDLPASALSFFASTSGSSSAHGVPHARGAAGTAAGSGHSELLSSQHTQPLSVRSSASASGGGASGKFPSTPRAVHPSPLVVGASGLHSRASVEDVTARHLVTLFSIFRQQLSWAAAAFEALHAAACTGTEAAAPTASMPPRSPFIGGEPRSPMLRASGMGAPARTTPSASSQLLVEHLLAHQFEPFSGSATPAAAAILRGNELYTDWCQVEMYTAYLLQYCCAQSVGSGVRQLLRSAGSLHTLFTLVKYGSPRLQRMSLRLLQTLLPLLPPDRVSRAMRRVWPQTTLDAWCQLASAPSVGASESTHPAGPTASASSSAPDIASLAACSCVGWLLDFVLLPHVMAFAPCVARSASSATRTRADAQPTFGAPLMREPSVSQLEENQSAFIARSWNIQPAVDRLDVQAAPSTTSHPASAEGKHGGGAANAAAAVAAAAAANPALSSDDLCAAHEGRGAQLFASLAASMLNTFASSRVPGWSAAVLSLVTRTLHNPPAADSMVVSHMSETMQEKAAFDGFTYKGDAKLK
ncbi:MAG: hypothetical protein EOO41_02425 [Methanobacteriota archaeon]|nr:MAG: hypothetical protein EOO41_02425 [Euryarchaeota archaeon]